MPTHAEKRILPYRPDQLFALVAGIEHYPKFLPRCDGAR
ncbi:MAG: SRPBCC family protein, partial [Ferrovibrio sp.]